MYAFAKSYHAPETDRPNKHFRLPSSSTTPHTDTNKKNINWPQNKYNIIIPSKNYALLICFDNNYLIFTERNREKKKFLQVLFKKEFIKPHKMYELHAMLCYKRNAATSITKNANYNAPRRKI